MLLWGQHGVSKDIASAVKWFERSAMQMKDPSAVYDYSILLMKVLQHYKDSTYYTIKWNTGYFVCVCVLTVIDSLIDVDSSRARE